MCFQTVLRRASAAAIAGIMFANIGATSQAQSAAQKRMGLRIVVIEGEDAVNIIQQKTAVAPVVEVRDENDLPVAGVLLRFRISGGRAVFGGGLDSVTLTTNAAGRATVSGLQPLQSGAYQIEVTATYQGQTTQATIRQNNFASVADAKKAGRNVQPGQGAAAAAGAATAAGVGAAGGGGTGGGAASSGATAGGAGGGGGVSKLVILGLAGAGAAGAAVAVNAATRNAAPSVAGVTPSASVTLLGTGTPITFSAQATDADNDAISYQWDFGDGSTSSDPSPSHVYTTAGVFTVRLTVSDGKKSATSEITVTVRTLTGTWRASPVGAVIGGTAVTVDLVFALTQSGNNVTGTLSGLTAPAADFPNCVLQGSVGTTSPRVVIQQQPCPGTAVNGLPIVFPPATFNFDPGADANTLNGTIGTQAVTLTRQ